MTLFVKMSLLTKTHLNRHCSRCLMGIYASIGLNDLHHEIPPCQDLNPNKASNGSLVRVEKTSPFTAPRYHTFPGRVNA
jgi:hypothetical protein